MKEYLKKYARDLVETKDRLQKENNKLILENKKLKEQLHSNSVGLRSEQLKVEDFYIGFIYEEYQMDSERYFNKGMIWVKKEYTLTSPRLYKIKTLIEEGKLRNL